MRVVVVLLSQPGLIRNILKCEGNFGVFTYSDNDPALPDGIHHEGCVGLRSDQTHSSLRLLQHFIASDFTRIAHIDSHLPL